jgi:MoaA/NifB/PqqE/SkfB family radical SAM enzyme
MLLSSVRSVLQNRDSRWVMRRLARTPHKLAKLGNLTRLEWARLRKDPTGGGGLPIIVSVEPTNACNMKCPMCPTGLDVLSRPKGMMDLDRFAWMLDQIDRSVLIMSFFMWGEPTLNPRLYDMIRLASRRGIFTLLTINGTRIDAGQILDSGLDYLVVSFDGTREESYGPVRVGGSLAAAREGVARLAEERARRGADRPRINMGFIVTKLNEAELPTLGREAESIGFDAARPKYLGAMTRKVAAELRPLDPRLHGSVGWRTLEEGVPGLNLPPILNRCGFLWHSASVHWDGTMVPCCYDWDAEEPLGNAFRTGFREIWTGAAYTGFRRRVLADKKSIGLCHACPGGDIVSFFSDSFLVRS